MDYLKLIRYKNLLLIATMQCLLRYGLILPILSHYGVDPVLSHLRFALVVLATVLLAASGYIINDYFDIRIDRINKPDKVLLGKRITRRTALFLHVLLTISGILIGLFIAYVARKESYALMFIGVPILLWYYSTTFKRHIVIGNLVISFLTGIVVLLVVSVEFAMLTKIHGQAIVRTEACSTAWFWTTGFAIFAFLANFIREIIKDAEDVKGDKAVGCKTLPIALGIPLAKVFVLILELVSLIVMWAIYFYIDDFDTIPYVLPYYIIGLTLPHLLLIYKWMKAQSPKEFHQASSISKLIILMGVLFILLAGQMF
ncbi:geranylgeranylglycerol-phosphate geranylgeranyltransferase [Carboxylicivirga sp. M1479]|uniref:geranylgeranylglycerol-phosphate geranylgeranyltransferase n=1 Tax=Carboxylicivirga sp. M1479 TaxID=2594476 RepID=UPI001177D5A2|nr:geranylgeranylglycerol-phosphate geranylgeranyltransferase [Carboxylicivirga sp. M1479]TRX63281.1 prenyltransferase [Carboxylicivirga sp. M1479]